MADGDLERRLGEVLRDRAGGFKPSGDLPARIGARTRQRAHNRRVAASMVAVAVLLGIAAPLALRDRGDSQETATLAVESATTLAAQSAADAQVSESAGATSRASEGGADTTAAASDTVAAAGSDTAASATEGAPAPPAAAVTSTVPAAVNADDAASGLPPYLLAVMPGDDRVALVSTATGDIVRYVEGSDSPGDVFYDDAGEVAFRAGGCGTTAQGVPVAGDDAVMTDAAWQDAVAITAWGSGPSQQFAWVTDNRCNGGNAFTLTLRTGAVDRSFSVPEVRDLAFNTDGTALVWSEPDGLAALDVTDPASPPWRSPSPDPGCPAAAVTPIDGTARVAVTTECAGDPARLFTLDPKGAEGAVDQGIGFAEVDAIDFDATAQWIAVTHSSGTDVVSAVTSEVVATIPGARSAHWTTASG